MLPTAQQIRDLTLASVKGTAEDTRIDDFIRTACIVLARYCLFPQSGDDHPSIDADEPGAAFSEFYNGPSRTNQRVLDLRIRPLVSITSVLVDDGTWTYATTYVANVDYVSTPQGKLHIHPTGQGLWPSGYRSIKVSGVMGFDVSTTDDVLLAVAQLVAHWWYDRTTVPSITNVSAGGMSATKADIRLPATVRTIMAPYRIVERETHV